MGAPPRGTLIAICGWTIIYNHRPQVQLWEHLPHSLQAADGEQSQYVQYPFGAHDDIIKITELRMAQDYRVTQDIQAAKIL